MGGWGVSTLDAIWDPIFDAIGNPYGILYGIPYGFQIGSYIGSHLGFHIYPIWIPYGIQYGIPYGTQAQAQGPKAVPGPGACKDKEMCHKKVEKSAPAYTFGTDNDRARRKQGKVVRAVYISKLHNEEKLGASSPGPGAYRSYAGNDVSNRQHSFNVRNLQFGTSNRDSFYKQYCGSEYAQGGESPGPGTYNNYGQDTSVNAKNERKKIGFSFGTSKRPPINITSLRC